MNNASIMVKNVSKQYKLYERPIDRLKESLHPLKKKYHRSFDALKNVNIELNKGETIGIIGKNGSGKSTLLKIITGVLSPTSGEVIAHGKVSALLELGTGFNPEFTGMQNIYLNGSIMGYTKEEMEARVPNILEFAGIGDFIHQPVKSYSSGMFARLAFAVAINVEPEILIIDEALSVGDFVFQNKCYLKIQELQKKGITILLVTHSNQQIIKYCDRAILLNEGNVVEDSYDVERVVFHYEELMRNVTHISNEDSEQAYHAEVNPVQANEEVNEHRFGTHAAFINDVFITSKEGVWEDDQILRSGSLVRLKIAIVAERTFESVVIGASFKDVNGVVLWGDNSIEAGQAISLKKGWNYFTFEFNMNFSPGEYLLYLGLADISMEPRVELDQRWPVKKINVISARSMAEGYIYAPAKLFID